MTVEPAQPDTKRALIPIEATAADKARVQKRALSPTQFWMNYYRTHELRGTHEDKMKDLSEQVTLLNLNKKSEDVQAVLTGFLTYHQRDAEPWIYEALALAIKMNHGKDKDVKTALGYAADLAERDGNPNLLVIVADLLLIHRYYDRVGKLLDEAAEKVPHRGEPLVMSMKLALETKDAQRMARSADRLLSLGWPGMDEAVRREARLKVENLAKTLREEGRTDEASDLLTRLTESEARDLFIRVTWLGNAGFDLIVDEPLGATASYASPRTVFGGTVIKNGYGAHPEAVYVCPRAFDGDYKVRIDTIYNDPAKPALSATLEIITHEGTAQEHKDTRTITIGKKAPEPVVVHLKGGRRKTVLPYVVPEAPPAPALAERKPKSKTKTNAGVQPPARTPAADPKVKAQPQ